VKEKEKKKTFSICSLRGEFPVRKGGETARISPQGLAETPSKRAKGLGPIGQKDTFNFNRR